MKGDRIRTIYFGKRRFLLVLMMFIMFLNGVLRVILPVSIVAIRTTGFPHHRCHLQAVVCASELGVNCAIWGEWWWQCRTSLFLVANRFWLEMFRCFFFTWILELRTMPLQQNYESQNSSRLAVFLLKRHIRCALESTFKLWKASLLHLKISIQNTYREWRSGCSFGVQPQTPTYNNCVSTTIALQRFVNFITCFRQNSSQRDQLQMTWNVDNAIAAIWYKSWQYKPRHDNLKICFMIFICFIFALRSAAVFSISQSIVADVSLMAEPEAKRQKTKVDGVGLDGKIGKTSDFFKKLWKFHD